MLVVFLFFFLLFAVFIGTFVLEIVIETINRKGELGLNLRSVICPRCQTKTKLYRTYSTIKSTWNGGACLNCGCELDKWGNEVPADERIPQLLEKSKMRPIKTFDENGKTPLEKVLNQK